VSRPPDGFVTWNRSRRKLKTLVQPPYVWGNWQEIVIDQFEISTTIATIFKQRHFLTNNFHQILARATTWNCDHCTRRRQYCFLQFLINWLLLNCWRIIICLHDLALSVAHLARITNGRQLRACFVKLTCLQSLSEFFDYFSNFCGGFENTSLYSSSSSGSTAFG